MHRYTSFFVKRYFVLEAQLLLYSDRLLELSQAGGEVGKSGDIGPIAKRQSPRLATSGLMLRAKTLDY